MKTFYFFETEAKALQFVAKNRWRKYILTPWESKDGKDIMKFVLWH